VAQRGARAGVRASRAGVRAASACVRAQGPIGQRGGARIAVCRIGRYSAFWRASAARARVRCGRSTRARGCAPGSRACAPAAIRDRSGAAGCRFGGVSAIGRTVFAAVSCPIATERGTARVITGCARAIAARARHGSGQRKRHRGDCEPASSTERMGHGHSFCELRASAPHRSPGANLTGG
jgi:hypothetical protein